MTRSILILALWAAPLLAHDKFFANRDIQDQAPGAFALQKQAVAFVHRIDQATRPERDALVDAILAEPELKDAIARWRDLTIEEQIPFLRRIFQIEVKVMKIAAPQLVIQSGIIPGPAFFEFDPTQPGTGKVILNPAALAKEEDKYASLSLLIHETRHSKQFQMAFPAGGDFSPFAKGYEAAFVAQKTLKGKLSFCDFLTLLNEYEAFQFGNYVVGKLTEWKVDMPGMGTYASQYDGDGKLKLDLVKLSHEVGQDNLLEAFNDAEKAQKELLGIP